MSCSTKPQTEVHEETCAAELMAEGTVLFLAASGDSDAGQVAIQ